MQQFVHGLAHIGVPCSNLDTSIPFYEQFGFRVVVRQSNLNGYHVAMVRCGSCTVELYEMVDKSTDDVPRRKNGHVDHIALDTSDLPALYRACQEKGIPIVSDGIENTTLWDPLDCSYFIIAGPDGERIEFAQIETV